MNFIKVYFCVFTDLGWRNVKPTPGFEWNVISTAQSSQGLRWDPQNQYSYEASVVMVNSPLPLAVNLEIKISRKFLEKISALWSSHRKPSAVDFPCRHGRPWSHGLWPGSQAWGACGGRNWDGPNCCEEGYSCIPAIELKSGTGQAIERFAGTA